MTVPFSPTTRRPLSVVHLTTGLELGGAELMLSRLVKAMRGPSITSRVVSLTGEGQIGPGLREAGIEVRSLGLARGQVGMRPVVRLRRWLHQWQPHVLSTWMYHADLLGAVATIGMDRPRLVWNLRASHIDLRHYRWLSRVTRQACVALSRRPAVVIANSHSGRAAHEAMGYRPRAWRVILNGIDTDRFRPRPDLLDAVRSELGVPAGALLVGVFARLDPMKGHDVLAGALARWLPHDARVHVLVAGTGVTADAPPYDALLAAHPALRARIHLTGPRPDVERLMAAADLACCPSISEGFPNAVAEAMACGLPCVVTSVGDAAELVDCPDRVAPPGDETELAARLTAVSNLPDVERQKIGRTARARIVARYGLEGAVSAYVELYQQVAGEDRA
mgnify:CR=1 FL=1